MNWKNMAILFAGSVFAVSCTTMKGKDEPSRTPQFVPGGEQAFNKTSEYSASCVRSDSGDSPEMTIYSADALVEGYVVLNEASGEAAHSLLVPVAIESTDVVHRLSGGISGVIETQGDSQYRSETSFTFDLNSPKLKKWLKANTNWSLNDRSITASFKCRN